MANAQLMQEELQQSVVLSEEDAEFEEDLPDDTVMADTGASIPAGLDPIVPAEQNEPIYDQRDAGDNHEDSDIDAIAEDDIEAQDYEHGDLEEAPVDEEDGEEFSSEDGDVHDDDGAFDIDAEGEDDDEDAAQRNHVDPAGASSGEEDEEAAEEAEDDDDEAEGVGAVKIKPGETDDEDSESEVDISSVSGSSDRESAAEWDEAVEHDDDEDEEDEDEDSETVDRNNCLFCKKDEENDPAEEFEAYLACKGCGDHAHQQCARNANALSDGSGASNWKCPECVVDDAESESESEAGFANHNVDAEGDLDMNGDMPDGDLSPTSTARTSAPKLARDLLPSQRGTNKPDSHSVFNQLVLVEDPMDGSRVLRKRKTSSAEAEEDLTSLRKKRKNTSDESATEEATQDRMNSAELAVRPRSARSLRQKVTNSGTQCTILKNSRSSLVLQIRVDATELRRIISQTPKSTITNRKRTARAAAPRASRNTTARRGGSASASAAAAAAEPPAMAPFFASSYSQPFYSFYDKETDELKGKPYGGILTEEQADTTKTLPTKDDRRRFDEAKQKAEEEWRNRLRAMQSQAEVPVKKSKKASGPASQIECIEFGGWEIDTWYAAPYPEEYSRNRVLYICEFCLKYMNSDYVAWRHKLKCPAKHPPGDEIYRHGSVSFFEVDGRKNPVYCQNLCLLAKLFLGSKTLYYDVEPFLFYVLCEYDDLGYHFVGYFSKEKRASSQNNVSCILTLPIHQRKGYGHLLIDFSYLLTRVEEKTGSPEKPLSDMGLVSYRNYWRLVLCKYLIDRVPEDKSQKKGLSIRQISDDTGMTPDDVISALEALRFLVRDPITQVYAFRVDLAYCHKEVAKWEAKNYVKLNPQALTWTPYVMGRSSATNFELGPALNTIAPREEDEDNKAVQVLADSGIATGDFAITDHTARKPLEHETAVLESTEPNDHFVPETMEKAKINGIGKENGEGQMEDDDARDSAEAAAAEPSDEDQWLEPYKSIPVNRFQVFPPITTRRPAMPRMGSSIIRPPALSRAPSSIARTPAQSRSRPRARRATGGASVRKAAPKKTSTAKRKTGGTGRGPGRWPKGTKKSDYGNADSGPGLPPAWIEREKQRQAALIAAKAQEEAEAHDTVQVQVKEAKGQKGKQVQTIAARFEQQDTPQEGEGVQSGDASAGKDIAEASEEARSDSVAIEQNDADIDADGDDE
ncbi:hypothetical protein F5X96DRAFT_615042 [Biscogniauxia mediterranea]|nr:hypothetical protein F5X96DRAFT_615042 [Biscogniauxia mediterranea]